MDKDNVVRSTKSIIERSIQLLHPMELHCHLKTTTNNTKDDKTLNANAEEYPPKRSAAAVAEQRIKDIVDNKNQ